MRYPKLRGQMAERNVKMIDLANLLGVKVSRISDRLSGKTKISLDEAFKIWKYLDTDLSLNELFEEG